MKVIYRLIRKDELSDLLGLHKYLFDDDLPVPDDKTMQSIWQEIITDRKMHCLVAETNRNIVASCILTVIPNLTRGGQPYGLIENVVTHVDYRKQGIGTGLLRYAQQTAWDNGCYKVMLMTGRQGDDILRFYESAGFKKGTKTAFIIRRDGK